MSSGMSSASVTAGRRQGRRQPTGGRPPSARSCARPHQSRCRRRTRRHHAPSSTASVREASGIRLAVRRADLRTTRGHCCALIEVAHQLYGATVFIREERRLTGFGGRKPPDRARQFPQRVLLILFFVQVFIARTLPVDHRRPGSRDPSSLRSGHRQASKSRSRCRSAGSVAS